jgi:hypothetical protein
MTAMMSFMARFPLPCVFCVQCAKSAGNVPNAPVSGNRRKRRRRKSSQANDAPDMARLQHKTHAAASAIDPSRLERAIKSWPSGGWHARPIEEEYHLALTRGIAGVRFTAVDGIGQSLIASDGTPLLIIDAIFRIRRSACHARGHGAIRRATR